MSTKWMFVRVVYNGEKETPETERMKLSDAYLESGEEIHLELKVTLHNVVYGEEKKLLKKSRALREYSLFMAKLKENTAAGMARPQAIREAIRYCETHDVMREFLQAHEREVVDMVDFEWNQEEYENAIREEGIEQGLERGLAQGREQGLERGLAQGREQGMETGKAMVVLGMLKEKLPLETIARVSDLSLDKIKEVGRLHSLL